MSAPRVLLTGASGFIGRHALPLLRERGYEVHAIARSVPPELSAQAQWRVGDLLDDGFVNEAVAAIKPSHLLHLGWYVEPGKFWNSPENLRWTQAGISLLRAFAAAGGRRVVGTGSCAEYDWRYSHCSEELTPQAPQTLYGACKQALQATLSAYARQAGFSAAWGRVFFLFGPHEYPNRLVPSVINAILREQPALCSHGEQLRDFMHVADVAGALVTLLDSEVTGAVNIAAGAPVRIKDLVGKIAEQLQRPDLLRLGALPASNEPLTLTADVTRLRYEVGWSPAFDLDRALAATIDWWREANKAEGE